MVIKVITFIAKGLGFIVGASSAASIIPEKYAIWGVALFAAASWLKEGLLIAGDILDDGTKNDSFKVS